MTQYCGTADLPVNPKHGTPEHEYHEFISWPHHGTSHSAGRTHRLFRGSGALTFAWSAQCNNTQGHTHTVTKNKINAVTGDERQLRQAANAVRLELCIYLLLNISAAPLPLDLGYITTCR